MKKVNSIKSKIAIYARVSTQDKQDFKRQVNDLTAIILKEGYKLEDIDQYSEKISGYKKNEERTELNRLENKIKESPKFYDCIYVTEVSRLGRNPKQVRAFIDDLTELEVPIYIQSINQKTMTDGKRNFIMSIVLQVLMEFADNEAETFKTRSRSGLLTSAKDGIAGGGRNLPYGYGKDESKKLICDAEEAKVIKDIFRLYKAGNGIKAISNILNDKKVPTRYNKAFSGKTINFKIEKNADVIQWSDKQIHDILRNTIYKGQRRFKGNILKAPPIISDELFDECTLLMQNKTHRNYLTTYTYLLKDLMVCGCCGRNYFAKYKPKVGGDKVYICSSRLKKNGSCGNIGVNISLIESALYHQLVQTDAILKYLNDTRSIKLDLERDIRRLTQQLSIDEKVILGKESELERLLELRLENIISLEKYVEKKSKLDETLVIAKERLTIIKKDLKQKEVALERQNDTQTTKKILIKARSNRNELQTIFRQVIHKIIFNNIDNRIGLATIYISINGAILKNTLKIFLDLQGIKGSKKDYRYFSISKLVNDVVFKNNVLLVEVDNLKVELLNKLKYHKWQSIEDKYLITM